MTVIHEFFGYRSSDNSKPAKEQAISQNCPFIGASVRCTKVLGNGTVAGVCAVKQATREAVVCCPNRLYGDDWRFLRDIAQVAFGVTDVDLVPGNSARLEAISRGEYVIAVFGKFWGGELHLPKKDGVGSYWVDWILALVDPRGVLETFVAVEVQSIDTTGSYGVGIKPLLSADRTVVKTTAGLNWENVNKRILPQIIYKGQVLQREVKCRQGLFFVTPKPVYDKVMERLLGAGQVFQDYPPGNGTITFLAYEPDWSNTSDGETAQLNLVTKLTTGVAQVAAAFTGALSMPEMGSYERAIDAALGF